jgi:oligopeptidase B
MIERNFLLVLFLSCSFFTRAQLQPPVPKKQSKVFNEHGQQRVDDYYWLSDKKDSNVINHLNAENAYFEASMRSTEALQQKLYDELVARIPQRDVSLPSKRNGYWYYTRFEEGKQYPYYVRKKNSLTAPEQIMLDVPEMAKNHQIFLLRGSNVSKDGKTLAFSIDTLGDRVSTLYFKDIEKGSIYPEFMPLYS